MPGLLITVGTSVWYVTSTRYRFPAMRKAEPQLFYETAVAPPEVPMSECMLATFGQPECGTIRGI
jgi:hypothetical protein